MNKKTVSVIIPNYNYEEFISERIDSVINQTYPISQLIILDDASKDNSVRIIEEKISQIKTRKPEIEVVFLKNKKNSGGMVFEQWQKGLNSATGDYIWIAEADDSSDKRFLEVAIDAFEKNKNVVLFYSNSSRINQNGEITAKNCDDWVDIWNCGRWKKSFVNSGGDEIKKYLSANNTIINVSSVVWKRTEELNDIFEEAKEYKIAGDWYIYVRVLSNGDIAYSSEPLNYYRKHGKGSVSTVTKLSREYKEVFAIQEKIRENYPLNNEQLLWQTKRRQMMGFVENKNNTEKKGRIAWFVPDFVDGSGGHRTIFQNINRLISEGYACDMYVKLAYSDKKPLEIYNDLVRWYGKFDGDIYTDYDLVKKSDMVFATSWDTAKSVMMTDVDKKAYFIQDYEPWFFPMSENYLLASETYNYGLNGVSIGRWLSNKIQSEYNVPMKSFSFCADLKIYHKSKVKKENAICFICQPFKPRRCANMGLKALQIVQRLRPDIKIYLYGSQKMIVHNLKAEHLGIITAEECNELYNKCKVGLCMSSSNPSRIPFEMMAAGLPVVDLYLENNIYDLPKDGCLLAEPSPEALAAAIIKILDDERLQKNLSSGGENYMKNFNLERGFSEFTRAVEEFCSDKKEKCKAIKPIYDIGAVKPMSIDFVLDDNVYFEEIKIEEPRIHLSIPRRIYLKIRYILLGR